MRSLLSILRAGVSLTVGSPASALITVGALDTPGSAIDVEVVGDLAYVADGYSGLRIRRLQPSWPSGSWRRCEAAVIQGVHSGLVWI